MKKSILKLAVIAAAIMLTSCGGGGTPKDITKNLYSALQKGDYKKAARIELENTLEYAEVSKEMKAAFVPSIAEEMREYAKKEYEGGMKSFEITGVEEDGDKCRVGIKVTDKNGIKGAFFGSGDFSAIIDFKKEDGKWWLVEKSNKNWR